MAMLLVGIFSIITLMVVVMGTPLMLYLKQDRRWEQSERSITNWYNIHSR